MVLLSKDQRIKLQKLYTEKKYTELEFEIESISSFKDRSAFLANLLGVTKLKKDSKTDKDWNDAKELFLDAHNKNPNDIDALCNYANISLRQRDYRIALNKLLERKRSGYHYKINEVLSRIYSFESRIDQAVKLYKENEKNGDLNKLSAAQFLSSLNYLDDFSQKEYLSYCKKINENFQITKEELDKLIDFSFDTNIKIGFISPDLKQHSVYYFLTTAIEGLKKNSMTVYLFNIGDPKDFDDASSSLKNNCDHWIDLYNFTDLDAANEIRKNKINILIDISGYFAKNRFMIFKYKPAPLQISWMGYVNTMGIKEVDYIIADPNLIKKDEENMYSEKVLRMPNIWNCHTGINEKVDVNNAPFQKNGYITFGCFNNPYKISENCIKVWSQILTKINDSKLILKGSSSDADIAKLRILKSFEKNNVDKDKIIFEKFNKIRTDHLKMYHNIDICLDTFPYPGVTTSFEAIWMGVPVLTKKGNNFVSRCGESINLNLNLTDFLAEDENDYIFKAISLSTNKEKIVKLRENLRDRSLKSALFDKKVFGNDFSSLMKYIWKKYKV